MSLKLHQKPSLPLLFLLFLLTSPSIQFKLGGRFFIKSHSNGGLVLLVQILGKSLVSHECILQTCFEKICFHFQNESEFLMKFDNARRCQVVLQALSNR